jgi:hypothetical protein
MTVLRLRPSSFVRSVLRPPTLRSPLTLSIDESQHETHQGHSTRSAEHVQPTGRVSRDRRQRESIRPPFSYIPRKAQVGYVLPVKWTYAE